MLKTFGEDACYITPSDSGLDNPAIGAPIVCRAVVPGDIEKLEDLSDGECDLQAAQVAYAVSV